jgi:uncharacterized membrane protein
LKFNQTIYSQEELMTQQPMNPDISQDDKLWAALGYPIWLIALIVLLMEDKKTRPFIKYHAIQSLSLNVVILVAGIIVTTITFGIGSVCWGIVWLLTIWPAVEAYNGKYLEIPVLTNLIKGWGWV